MVSTRSRIALLIYGVVNAVLFGIGVVAVLSVPAWAAQAAYLIPAVVVLSLVLSAPLAWWIAPRLRARFARRQAAREAAAAL
jgi:hypothetical protein